MPNIIFGLLVLLTLAGGTGCAGRDYNPTGGSEVHPSESAAYVNKIVDPDLPADVYRDCTAGAWYGSANAGSSGKGHHVSTTHKCAPTATRIARERLYGNPDSEGKRVP